MQRPTYHYIGKCRGCGAILSSVYDMVDMPRDTAEALSKMARRGLEIERVALGSVEFSNMICTCPPPSVTDGLPLFEKEIAQ